jgi:hypothetical protein
MSERVGDPLFNADGTPWRRVLTDADLEGFLADVEGMRPSDVVALVIEVQRLREAEERLREMCDKVDRLDPFDQDAYNLGTYDVRQVLDGNDPWKAPDTTKTPPPHPS